MSTDQPETPETESEPFIDDDGVLYDEEVTPEYGVLGFTLRELLIVGIWLVAFIVSFFPLAGDSSIWSMGIQWILPIGVPTVAVFLLVLRRFSPDGIRRVGSLGIDQFASVAFSVAATVWLGSLWTAVAGAIEFGAWTLAWTGVVQLIAMLALVVLTVFAPIIPPLNEDFQGRLVTLAHRNANPVRPVIPRPRPVATQTEPAQDTPAPHDADAAHSLHDRSSTMVLDVELSGQHTTDEISRAEFPSQVPLAAHASGGGTGTEATSADGQYVPSYARRSRGDDTNFEPVVGVDPEPVPEPDEADLDATNPRDVAPVAPVAQPFWILAPTERDVHDERGEPVFRIGPTAWALVIEDRGGAYVVRHDDGRIGYLHEIADVTKG